MDPGGVVPVEEIVREDHRPASPHAQDYIHMKMVQKGLERPERHPSRHPESGVSPPPKKSGKGGKFTWEGPVDPTQYDEEDVPVAIDEKDPNYVDEAEEEADKQVAAGVVDVAKLVPHDIAVVEVVVPVDDEQDEHRGYKKQGKPQAQAQ